MTTRLTPGTRDDVGDVMATSRAVRAELEKVFDAAGFAFVHPPILAETGPFLARSGEAIRQRMYIFQDPGGREICLRPELTIPTARLYLENIASPPKSPVAKLAYIGPVFRYMAEENGVAPLREYRQAGAEWIGDANTADVDAQILSFAMRAADAAGVRDARIVMGDVGLAAEAVRALPIADRAKGRLLRQLWQKDHFFAALKALNTMERDDDLGAGARLAGLDAAASRMMVEEILALANVRHVGARTAEEIAERLTAKAEDAAGESVSDEVVAALREWHEIKGPSADALDAARSWFARFDAKGADARIEPVISRLAALDENGFDPGRLTLDLGLRGGLEYYTGMIFDIHGKASGEDIVIGGGGRYDGLLRSLGSPIDVPAAGFALNLSQVARAIGKAPR